MLYAKNNILKIDHSPFKIETTPKFPPKPGAAPVINIQYSEAPTGPILNF